eukprot:CAMPEP_0185733046 /NCGR_PEP_ID=MMETSP1171-20130828/18261_1 /TAXON_ID=374046 /ORGANISM="Helicotheca tamensis, Strain CCMP826" /LENGTH=242 /DNA_ID=CAMNT_0028402671 /DNA_START=309 /DNA_END=1037 /DNA_ORIENTATION=-
MGHRQLPWGTTYVILSADSRRQSNMSSNEARLGDSTGDLETEEVSEHEGGDDIHEVDESRTFLASVSAKSCTINWLAHDENFSETMLNESVCNNPASIAHYHAQQHNFHSGQRFLPVQHSPQQNSYGYSSSRHWPHQQTDPHSRRNQWYAHGSDFQHGGHFTASHAEDRHYRQNVLVAEKNHQLQQHVQHRHPTQWQVQDQYHHRESTQWQTESFHSTQWSRDPHYYDWNMAHAEASYDRRD